MTSTATTETLTAACLEKIRSYGNVTFVELAAVLRANGVDPSGPFTVELSAAPNVILWAGMSEQFCDVAEALRATAELNAAHPLVYMFDGGMLQLPIAKKPPRNGYRKPHWAPVVFSVRAPRHE